MGGLTSNMTVMIRRKGFLLGKELVDIGWKSEGLRLLAPLTFTAP